MGNQKNNSPCYQCLKREVNCHSNCEEYKDWRNKLRDEKRKINEHINPSGCQYFKQKYVGSYATKSSKKRYK